MAQIKEAQDYAEAAWRNSSDSREELATLRSKYDKLEKERNNYLAQVEALERRIHDLESQLQGAKDEYYNRLLSKDEDIANLRAEINRMMVEFQDLMDVKIQLDVEIAAYRKLLEGEEARLNIHAQVQETEAETPSRRGMKRKRFLESSEDVFETAHSQHFKENAESDGDVEIEPHDMEGNFIRLHNKSDDTDVNLGGWYLKRVADGKEATYKFHARQTIKPGKTLTVWAADSEGQHAPPSDIKMKQHNKWPLSDSFRSILVDHDGDTIAWRDSKREYGSGYASGLASAEDPDQRCSIM